MIFFFKIVWRFESDAVVKCTSSEDRTVLVVISFDIQRYRQSSFFLRRISFTRSVRAVLPSLGGRAIMKTLLQRSVNRRPSWDNSSATSSGVLVESFLSFVNRSFAPMNRAIISYSFLRGKNFRTSAIPAPGRLRILKFGKVRFFNCESPINKCCDDDFLNM